MSRAFLFSLGLVSFLAFTAPLGWADPAPPIPPVPKFTVGESQLIPVIGKNTWYVNDSVFPWLPDKAGTGRVAFWGDGCVIRYSGPDILHLAPPADNKTVTVTDAPGTNGDWHRNGGWMLTATRTDDGTLVGFVHGEDHQFADTKYGEWNSTGVWTSQDDGVTWINQGEVVGRKKPDVHGFGGMALNECLWDAAHKRWLGYSGPYAFVSSDPHAMPGTWRGYHDGDFTQPVDVNADMPALTPAPGLEHAGVTWGGLTYNSYLKQYIMTWETGKAMKAAFSPDGVNWGPVTTLVDGTAPGGLNGDVSYTFIAGDTVTISGQDCYVVYMLYPATGKAASGNRKDMIRRPLHFKL